MQAPTKLDNDREHTALHLTIACRLFQLLDSPFHSTEAFRIASKEHVGELLVIANLFKLLSEFLGGMLCDLVEAELIRDGRELVVLVSKTINDCVLDDSPQQA